MSAIRPKITDVFTPRSATVNPAMYIDRPAHQRDLKRAVEGSLHAILCGESGGGKSWLYRHVARVEGWTVFYANAGNAARQKTLTGTIALAIHDEGDREWTEYSQKLEGKLGAFGIGAGTEAGRKYEVKTKEILWKAFRAAREKAGDGFAVVVVDNLEAIFGKPDLTEELGNIILLLDDPDYAKYRVKMLIVGVPYGVVEYYQQIENLETISNRIKEIPAVTAMHWGQIEDFVRRGFVEQLKIKLTIDEVTQIARHVAHVTLGIAQRLHEYCELLAYNIQDSEWLYDPSLLQNADQKFLSSCLKKAHSVVDGCMNERRTKTGRRNQVLFALGRMNATEFDATAVEKIVREHFPISTDGVALAVGQTLADLSTGDFVLLRRAPKGATYRFADPRYLMCTRVMLRKSKEGERVIKATFRR
jgi:hypothetical protein